VVGHIAKVTYLQPNVVGVSVLRETELLMVSYYKWIGFIQRLLVKIDLFRIPFYGWLILYQFSLKIRKLQRLRLSSHDHEHTPTKRLTSPQLDRAQSKKVNVLNFAKKSSVGL